MPLRAKLQERRFLADPGRKLDMDVVTNGVVAGEGVRCQIREILPPAPPA
jgi:hypothetical protein